jgi:CHAD domain-containing protein
VALHLHPSVGVMSFALARRKHLGDELTKVVRRELRKASRALRNRTSMPVEAAIHESRKSVKKVRAAAALLERAGAKLPRKDRKRLKAAGKALSRLRDSAATVATLDRVRRRYPKRLPETTYDVLHRALVNAQDQQGERAERAGVAIEAAKALRKARRSAKAWTPDSIGLPDLVEVVGDSYRRSRKAMQRARETGQSATLHRWRKALKTLWYQLRLARPLTTGVAPLIADLKRLETELGNDHDLVILRATLRACGELRPMRPAVRQVDRLGARIRQQLRRRAFSLGRRVQARTPRGFARWLRSAMMKQARRRRG